MREPANEWLRLYKARKLQWDTGIYSRYGTVVSLDHSFSYNEDFLYERGV